MLFHWPSDIGHKVPHPSKSLGEVPVLLKSTVSKEPAPARGGSLTQRHDSARNLPMEAIQAEIARKRKEREAAAATLGGGGEPRKWMRKGDVEKYREAEYLKNEAEEQEARLKKLVVPQHRDAALAAEQAAQKQALLSAQTKNMAGSAEQQHAEKAADHASASTSAAGPSSSSIGADAETALRPVDVMRRLRALGQPIRLFAETEEERYDRYRAVSSALPTEAEVDLELKKGQMFDQRQLFDESGNARQETAKVAHEAEVGVGGNDDEDEEAELDEQFVPTTAEESVAKHFKTLIKLWEEELEAREPAEASSQAGRTVTATFQQCKRHTRAFFKQLRTRTMPLDVLSTMVEITQFMQQREYVKAHDAYIRCAIGTAPWPMGITGTGIHERQGRQHLRESKVAHVMNDETQRKYLQSIKRLMTFAQKKLPADPSKMVLTNW